MRITDPAGRMTTLTIDEHGDLVSILQPGQTTPMTFLYDAEHRMTHEQDERGNVTTNVYDEWGALQQTLLPPRPVYDPLADRFTMTQEVQDYAPADSAAPTFDGLPGGSPANPNQPPLAAGQTIPTYFSTNGYTYTLQLNALGALTHSRDPLGRETQIERDEHNRMTRLVTPQGNCLEYTYDDADNVLSESRMDAAQCALPPEGRDPAQVQTVRYTYEARFNHVKTETDALGRILTYTYDYEVMGQGEHGLLVATTYPPVQDENGAWVTPQETWEYNAWGQVTRATDRRGVATCYAYTSANDPNPFAPGVPPVPGLLTQMTEDCGGELERTTTWREFNALGLAQHIIYPGDAQHLEVWLGYDARGNLISQTLSGGLTTLYAYDAADNLIQMVEDPHGQARTTEYTYDAANLLSGVRTYGGGEQIQVVYGYDLDRNQTLYQDGRGNRTRYVYDAIGQLTQVIDAAGGVTRYTYTPEKRLHTLTNARGVVIRLVYDAFGRQIEQIADDGGLNLTTQTAYNLGNQPVLLTDAAGRKTCLTYDSLDRVMAETADCGGLNATTRYAYNLNYQPVLVTDTLGYATRYGYDRLDRLTAITDALGHAVYYDYDIADNLIRFMDELGNVTRYGYDALGNTLAITDALGAVTRYAYNLWDDLVSMTDKLGNVTTYAYDGLGRRARVVNPLGGVTQYAYDANGNRTTITDPLGRTRRYEYDPRDRPIRQIDPAGYASTMTYDALGNLRGVQDALGRAAAYRYDALNRPIVFTNTLGLPSYSTYDAVDNLLSTTDTAGKTTLYAYDSLDRRVVITDANGSVTRMAFDLRGQLSSVTDPLGNVTTYEYDAIGRPLRETNPLGAQRQYTYDAAGRLVAYTDRNNRTRAFAYDALHRLTAETWVGAGRVMTFGYNPQGYMTGAADPDSRYAMTYNALGLAQTVSNADTPGAPAVMLAYTYDLYGNTRAVSETIGGQAGGVTEYQYDARNLTTRLTQSGAGVANKRVDLSYDALGRLSGLARYRDLNGAQPVGTSALTYDARSNIVGAAHTPATGSPFAYTWAYDAVDRLTGSISPQDTAQFTYDHAGQLLTADYTVQSDEAYAYDANGNRAGAGYAVGADNRLLADGVYTYTYDAEGNLTRRVEIASGAVTEYTWDYRNRLTGLTFKDSTGAVTQLITNTYDVNNLRIGCAVDADGAGPGAAQVERFVYDGANVALIFDGAGSLQHRYLHGPAPDMLLAEESSGGTRWALFDQLGAISDILDDNGALVNHITYDSFGRILSQSNPAHSLRFAYAGREWDAAAGLYYYRSRYYDPRQGRFISQDTVGFGGSDTNLYRYVYNSPLNYTDPEGYGWFDDAVNWTLNAIPVNREVDQFVSGVGNTVSMGITDYVREKTYGDLATANHQGGYRTAGEIVGTGLSLAIPGGALVKGAKAGKVALSAKESAQWSAQLFAKARQLERAGQTAKAAKIRANAQMLMEMAASGGNKALRLRQGLTAAKVFNAAQTGTGITNLGLKLTGLNCKPVSWTDWLAAIPLAGWLFNPLRGVGKSAQSAFLRDIETRAFSREIAAMVKNKEAARAASKAARMARVAETNKLLNTYKTPSKADLIAKRFGFQDARELDALRMRMTARQTEREIAAITQQRVDEYANAIRQAQKGGQLTTQQADDLINLVKQDAGKTEDMWKPVDRLVKEVNEGQLLAPKFDLLAPGSGPSLPKIDFGTGGGGGTNPFGFTFP